MWDAILDDAKYWWKLVKANKNTFKEIACYKKAINGLEKSTLLAAKSDDNT